MWKKEETPKPTPSEPQPAKHKPPSDSLPSPPAKGERATIGRSITLRGEVSGDEDLLIQGHVEGSVDLKQQAVTVGREGQVKANIAGRMVIVEGEVEGDLKADEQVILRSSARVQGDIAAPRVVLEDGANFRGGIDMGTPPAKGDDASHKPTSFVGAKPSEPAEAPPPPSPAASGLKKDSAGTADKPGA